MFEDISKVVLVTDMDGTLLNSKKEVTPKDRKAIEYFMSLGGRFTVATGRTIQSFSHYYDLLDLRFPVIMFNGSVIYDKSKEKVVYTECMREKLPLKFSMKCRISEARFSKRMIPMYSAILNMRKNILKYAR